MPSKSTSLNKADFEKLSEFRYQIRRFERFSENAVQAEGITPLQYLLLLHIKGYPDREWATVGELAERLQAQPHGVAALVTRCEALELVQRQASKTDGRQVEVHLLPKGAHILAQLAAQHRDELNSLKGRFTVPFIPPEEEE